MVRAVSFVILFLPPAMKGTLSRHAERRIGLPSFQRLRDAFSSSGLILPGFVFQKCSRAGPGPGPPLFLARFRASFPWWS